MTLAILYTDEDKMTEESVVKIVDNEYHIKYYGRYSEVPDKYLHKPIYNLVRIIKEGLKPLFIISVTYSHSQRPACRNCPAAVSFTRAPRRMQEMIYRKIPVFNISAY